MEAASDRLQQKYVSAKHAEKPSESNDGGTTTASVGEGAMA